ncbi:hypothetical protein [Streptomyces griseus]|uniref:hypothetical protein n=1 Tax=Streptomyces griseus TaxID=1911 RepID=UPI0037000D7A
MPEELAAWQVDAQDRALGRTGEMEQLRTKNERMRHELEVMYGGAFDTPPAQTVSERLALVEALVSDFVDPDPCWFDHHGYCQAHGWAATDPLCPHGRAKALGLEETEEGNS